MWRLDKTLKSALHRPGPLGHHPVATRETYFLKTQRRQHGALLLPKKGGRGSNEGRGERRYIGASVLQIFFSLFLKESIIL